MRWQNPWRRRLSHGQFIAPNAYRLIAPIGTKDLPDKVSGRLEIKPWEYTVTAVIPHLDTIELLPVCVELLRAQSIRPYIIVIDTGSPPEVCRQLAAMRAEDLEVHFIAGHGWRHSSEPVAVALDLAHALCRTKLLFHTHADCFLRRRDLLETWARICNSDTPAIGYRMSPRDWATADWEWMLGHTLAMLYMPTMHRIGASWSMQRMKWAFGYPWKIDGVGGWPDTETGFNCVLRAAGIVPVFLGFDRNHERQIDENMDHCRSYPGAKIYAAEYFEEATKWAESAMVEGWERARAWRGVV